MSAQVILTATRGALRGREFTFRDRAQYVVGRSRSCDVTVPMEDYTVSRHHCLLDLEDSAVSVRDLNSLNGTYLNGALIGRRDKRLDGEEASLVAQPKYTLEEGDELRVGDVVFRVSIAGSPEEKGDSDTEVKAARWDYTACL